MDGEEFSMPSPKRQRTNSPEAHSSSNARPGETVVDKDLQPTSDAVPETVTEVAPTEMIVDEDNAILDTLMQHVEAEAAPYAPPHGPGPTPVVAIETTPHVEHTELASPDTKVDGVQEEASDITHGLSNLQEVTNVEVIDAPALVTEQPTTAVIDTAVAQISILPVAPTGTASAAQQADGIPPTEAIEPAEGADGPEWEVDSSPYESSSDSDTTDSSDDDSDDDDAEGDYAMLDPEEAARILMQGDAGSDDEGDRSRNKGEGSGLRTANEVADDVPPVPDITITDDMKIEELGHVEAIVENNVLIIGKVSGEYQVLESGSLLCLQDRTIAGVVAETLGRVEQPLYTMKFSGDQDIKSRGLAEKGTAVFYVPKHSSFVFTQPLKAFKGSDASNFHDEEVGDDEMEFSDDEAEAEHKRQAKLKRQGRSGEIGRGRGAGRGGRGSQRGGYKSSPLSADTNGAAYMNGSIEMNYDDVEEGEEGYTPLARPNNFQEMMSQTPRTDTSNVSHMPPPPFGHSGRGDRGRGRNQHRGGRGNDRGGRGNFRGNHNHGNRGGNYQQSNRNPNQQQSPYSQPNPQGQLSYPQTPSAPALTPHNPSYPYSVVTSPMSPLPKSQYNFSAGFQAPQSQSPTFYQQQQQWPPQMPAGFSFNNPAMMQFAQQFQQGQQTQQQQGGWQVNQAAAAEVQRQLEEMRRAQGGGQ